MKKISLTAYLFVPQLMNKRLNLVLSFFVLQNMLGNLKLRVNTVNPRISAPPPPSNKRPLRITAPPIGQNLKQAPPLE